MRKSSAILVVLVLAFGLSCQTIADAEPAGGVLSERALASKRVDGLAGIKNAGRVASGIYRGAQPRGEGFETLKEIGIRTVVNLRSMNSEAKEVEAAGMRSIHIPIGIMRGVNEETINRAVAVISDPENQPVFVHCAHGKDRTGVVVAVYRMELEGWSYDEAEAEMQYFGFHDIWFNLKSLLKRYRKEE